MITAYSVKEAAEYLGVSTTTLLCSPDWKKVLPAYRRSTKRGKNITIFPTGELEAFKKSGEYKGLMKRAVVMKRDMRNVRGTVTSTKKNKPEQLNLFQELMTPQKNEVGVYLADIGDKKSLTHMEQFKQTILETLDKMTPTNVGIVEEPDNTERNRKKQMIYRIAGSRGLKVRTVTDGNTIRFMRV